MTRALVLGGSVFVGKRLVEALVAAGTDVAVLNRGKTVSELPDGVERLVADRTDRAEMQAALQGRDWDAVYDVSGFVMAAGGSDMEHLLAMLDGRTASYVYTSSIMAYDQSWVGVFPWTEDQPSNPEGASSYGGFKALAERAILARHAATGFPGCAVRPAAIYGPDNNIYDMELPMFLRLLQHRPILVPHGGLVTGSYGHVDDLCDTMVAISADREAEGQVFNVSGGSVDVNRYIAVLADVVGVEPNVVHVPDALLEELSRPGVASVFGHLFKQRHHAIVDCSKVEQLLGGGPRYDLASGHAHTFEWFLGRGHDRLVTPLADPVWKATWDFDAEAAVAARIASGE